MEGRANELRPDFRRATKTDIIGYRTCNSVTLNPVEAGPDEQLYINIPKLGPNTCIVPDTTRLCFVFESGGTKARFRNNLGKLLFGRLTVKVGGEIVYDNGGEGNIGVYKDLWISDHKRANMIEYGIANENTRKLLSSDDSGASSGTDEKVNDGLMKTSYTRMKLKLGKILNDHGLYAPYAMMSDLQYVITLPSNDEIMEPQSGESSGSYKLTGIRMEYDTIESPEIVRRINDEYEIGRDWSYEHVTLMKKTNWDKSDTKINESINLPRESMKAIVMLFKEEGSSDSEDFAYPNIEKVKVTVEGKPNSVYSRGLLTYMMYDEASKIFGSIRDNCNDNVSCRDFYKDKFALVIDLRSVDDNKVIGSGRKLLGTQSGVLLEIEKKATTKDLKCSIYVLSDGLINFAGKRFQGVKY